MGSSSLEDIKSKKFWTAVGAEFMGTAILVLVACGSALSTSDPDLNSKVGTG
jgi:glycerol uptake facilitator-like aquaporin